MEEKSLPESDVADVIREETARGRRPVNTDAQREQRRREIDQAEDEQLILRVLKERDLEKLLRALLDLGLPELQVRRVERLWGQLYPETKRPERA